MTPLSSHGSLQAAGALMAFRCLTCAHMISAGLLPSWEEKEKRNLHPFRWQFLRRSEQWGLWNTPDCNQTSTYTHLFAEGPRKREGRGRGETPPTPVGSPYGPPKCCDPCVSWKRIPRLRGGKRKMSLLRQEILLAHSADFLMIRESRGQ